MYTKNTFYLNFTCEFVKVISDGNLIAIESEAFGAMLFHRKGMLSCQKESYYLCLIYSSTAR